jgi:alpha-glucosidase (family GH31 glycosyl hydrolase)
MVLRLMPRSMLGALARCGGLALAAACGGGEIDDAPGKPPATGAHGGATVGDFTVLVESVANFSVTLEGRPVLDGLTGGSADAGGPPFSLFAVRDATWGYEEQFGQYKVTDQPVGDWRVATSIAPVDGPGHQFILKDVTGATIARLALDAPVGRHLRMQLTTDDPTAKRLSFGFQCRPDDRWVGFGEQSWDVDQTGQTVPVFVSEQGIGKDKTDDYTGLWSVRGRRHSAQWAMPWTLGKRGLALIAETDRRSQFAMCSERADAARIEVDLPAKIHLFAGKDAADTTALATEAFGRPRVPPLLAFAPWNDAIKGPARVLGTAQALRDADVPSSAIWTEDWKGGHQNGDAYPLSEEWDVDPTLYPDMKGMTDQLHAQGFAFFVYFNPFVYKEVKAFGETAPKGLLVARADGTPYTFSGAKFTETGLLDVTNPDAVAWAVGKMRAAIDLGADGWMHDYGEWLPMDAKLAGGSGLDLHMKYPVLWQEIARKAIDGVGDGHDRLFFARSGWFGTPALVDVFWAGDQRTDFEADDGLPSVPTMGINLSVHGLPAYGHDIAGYQSTTNPPSTKDLFFRWTSFGAFSPVMRTHHGYQADKQWTWQSDAETTAHWRRWAIEHVQLAPYLAAAAKAASENGVSIMRGLFFAFPGEDAAWTVRDEYLLGPSILVAPVIEAGATGRSLWLPPGRWYPWTGGPAQTGGAMMSVDAPAGEIPAFGRAGSVIARYPATIRTLTRSSAAVPGPAEVGDDREVLAFFGGDGTFVETGGLSYQLVSDPAPAVGPATYAWNGSPLAACASVPVAPCVTADDGAGATAQVTGAGALAVAVSSKAIGTVTIAGGAAGRKLSIRVRR